MCKKILLTLVSVLVFSVSSFGSGTVNTLGFIPYDTISDASDAYYRMYPMNYEVKDLSGNRLSPTQYKGTSDKWGKYYIFQIPEACANSWTLPLPVAAYDHMTVQTFVCNAIRPGATPGSTYGADPNYVTGDADTYGIYRMVGDASGAYTVWGSAMYHPDHFLAKCTASDVLEAVATAKYKTHLDHFMAPIPDLTWEGSRYASSLAVLSASASIHEMTDNASPYSTTEWLLNREYTLTHTAGYIEPASYPIYRLGVHHFGIRGQMWATLNFNDNSATKCVVIRLNRDLVSDTMTPTARDAGVTYP